MSVLRPIVKLTAVTITYEGKKCQEFILCRHEAGRAILSQERLNKMLDKMKVPRGGTYTVG